MVNNGYIKCIRNNVKIYPVMYDKYHFKIEIDYDGRKKQGSEMYKWKTEQKQLLQKIKELYENIGQNIQSRE